jgi:RibD C-terminal domain
MVVRSATLATAIPQSRASLNHRMPLRVRPSVEHPLIAQRIQLPRPRWAPRPRPRLACSAGADDLVVPIAKDGARVAVPRMAPPANDLAVRIGGGPTTVREFLAADLIDHLHVIVVPIVIGRGIRLWDGLEGVQERLDVQTVSTPSGVAHLTFVRKPR